MISRMLKQPGWLKVRVMGVAGQSLIETALTLPLLIVLVMGGAEMACVAYAAIEVANAAKAAVQYGAQSPGTAADTPGIQTAASNETTNLVSTLTTTPKVALVCSNGTVPADSTTGPPWSNLDCSTSNIEEVLTVTTTATYASPFHIGGLLTSYPLHGYAVQKVLSSH